jgi:TonB family protein
MVIIGLSLGVTFGQEDTLRYADGSYEVGTVEDGLKDGYWMSYYPDGTKRSEGTFVEGLRVGRWTWYHENGLTKAVEKWKDGIYQKGEYWDVHGKKSDISVALTNPEYPGGMEAFTRMIAENLVYPEAVINEGVEGQVVLHFQIGASGRLLNPVVSKQAHPELAEEALRVIQLSERWTPAEFHGRKTSTSYTFPITFALQ